MTKKLLIFISVVVLCVAFLCGCSGSERKPIEDNYSLEQYEGENPVAVIKVKDLGNIYVELYPDVAPNTVNNFISLAKSGYYDGAIFHRVIENFMIQGGDPEGTGGGGPGYTIKGEFSSNGFTNDLDHERGVISMARRGDSYNSAGSQFFIMHVNYPYLNGDYATFGKVISGMDVVDAIATTETDSSDKPVEDVIMESVTVETWGVEYPEPEKIQ
ncbi:MAG: peptidylprolyl isomerase [Ruminococcaceae bacterium]|nr:peptidylprolyl isomerase [Oscillospiraceae bacterium]